MACLNSSFVFLICQNDNPTGLGEYRSISLVGSICQIMAKVLVIRLKSAMNTVIGEAQSMFLGGRNIFYQLEIFIEDDEISRFWKQVD